MRSKICRDYFDAVEINTTFYQPLRPEIARLWATEGCAQPQVSVHRETGHAASRMSGRSSPAEIAQFKEGLWPLQRARKLGCVLMQFPWTFRYTEENRELLIALRRAFHEFPLVAEMRHSSWTHEEALGTLIDYHVGFANIDQAAVYQSHAAGLGAHLVASATCGCTAAIRRIGSASSAGR